MGREWRELSKRHLLLSSQLAVYSALKKLLVMPTPKFANLMEALDTVEHRGGLWTRDDAGTCRGAGKTDRWMKSSTAIAYCPTPDPWMRFFR